jgi:hypothetical protein
VAHRSTHRKALEQQAGHIKLWKTWWARQDLNPEPDGYEPSALTIELQAPTWWQWLQQFVAICYSFRGWHQPQPYKFVANMQTMPRVGDLEFDLLNRNTNRAGRAIAIQRLGAEHNYVGPKWF